MKHAYMILAHNNFKILEKLIKQIDYKNNDIFIHVDKKVKDFDFEYFKKIPKTSKIIFCSSRIDVRWGSYSQIEVMYELLREARKNGEYGYYHLLSGVDFPLKTQKYIHEFFEKNNGKEFIYITDWTNYRVSRRYKYYHVLDKNFRNNNKYVDLFFDVIRESLIFLQRFVGIDRTKKDNLKYMMGAQWFSITGKLVNDVLADEKEFSKKFKMTRCCDEIFLTTYIYNSKYKESISSTEEGNMRLVCWNKKGKFRGSPYVFTINDFDELIKSNKLFARKFDEEDIEIINKLDKYLSDYDK